jgi:transcriptional regulator with XRE-family HTH domain
MFKDELKRVRLSACMTQKALAEKTGIPLGSIKNWERGNYLPSVRSWEKLQSYFMLNTRVLTVALSDEYYKEKVLKYGKKKLNN